MLSFDDFAALLVKVTEAESLPELHRYEVSELKEGRDHSLLVHRLDGLHDDKVPLTQFYHVYLNQGNLSRLENFKEEVPERRRSIVRGILIEAGIYSNKPPYKKLPGY